VAVYGDCRGNREAHRAVVAAVRAEHPDLVVFTGDAVDCWPTGHMPDLGPAGYLVPLWPQVLRGYPFFSLATLIPFPQLMHETVFSLYHPVRDRHGWNGFLEDTAPLRLGDRVPFLFVPGNHDLYHRFDREAVATLFGEPGGPGGRDPRALRFALDAGGVRFVVLDTGTDMPGDGDPAAPGGEEVRWLDATLADAAARGLLPVVAFHRPAYSSGAEDPVDPGIGEGIGAVLARRGVPLALCGHAHAYERLERPRDGGGTTTFLVTGGAGAPFHHEVEPEGRDPGSRVFAESVLHFVLLEIGPGAIRGRALAVPRPGSGEAPREIDAFEVPR
jgi:3',5'-cyclic AMP phosphodiesterase CpdA